MTSGEMKSVKRRPGEGIAKRPLHFIWIADCSGSMGGEKIVALNNAIREAIPHMRNEAAKNPNAEVLVRAVRFSNGADWHIREPVPLAEFEWKDLSADGETDMGEALKLVAAQLSGQEMPRRAIPPVLVLISDGHPTDDFKSGLRRLQDSPWGRKAVRQAVAIGKDADRNILKEFIGDPEFKVIEADNVEDLMDRIKIASTTGLRSASMPHSRSMTQATASDEPEIF